MIHGGGAAAHCTAHLLRKAGVGVMLASTGRAKVPALLLSHAAIALIESVLEKRNLLGHAHRIDRRVVLWGSRGEPQTLSHAGVVVSEAELIRELSQCAELFEEDSRSNWRVISASSVIQSTAAQQPFGSRVASAIHVRLRDRADASACWIEALRNGWLFLLPNGPDSAWLLSVGSEARDLLNESRLIPARVDEFEGEGPRFPAHPRISSPLCGPGWLSCGTAAMAFDPICGDGTGNAVREAVLAAAVIRAAEGGEQLEKLLAHYEARLLAGFERHLALCRSFYQVGFGGPWWESAAASLEDGVAWCRKKRGEFPDFQFRLQGSELVAVN